MVEQTVTEFIREHLMAESVLLDRYPAAPDGSVEVEREQMTSDDFRYARWALTQQSLNFWRRADALDRWWRAKRRAERAAPVRSTSVS
jgi:hypothetical protein